MNEDSEKPYVLKVHLQQRKRISDCNGESLELVLTG